MIVDKQGRFLGRINLLDGLALLFLLSLAGTAAYVIHVSRHWSLDITSVEPKRIVAGPGRYVMMKGTGFDQSTTIQIGPYAARGGVYFDESTIGIEINEEIEPGTYRIIVRDGRGRYVVLPDAVQIIWVPQITEVKPRMIYNRGRATRVDLSGKFFARSCSVRVGKQAFNTVGYTIPGQISAELEQGSSLPLGERPVTVTNPGGQSDTLKHGVTVLPLPEVDSVAPDRMAVGDTADLIIRGRHLREGMQVWFEEQEHPLGQATLISPECLQIRVTAKSSMRRANDLILQLPNGPKLTVLQDAVHIDDAIGVFVVMAVQLDEQSSRAVGELQGTLEWKFSHTPSRKPNTTVIDVLLPARVQIIGEKLQATDLRCRPLRAGESADFSFNGRELSGIVVDGPYAVFADAFFKDKRG